MTHHPSSLFADLLNRRMSRRDFLKGMLAVASGAVLPRIPIALPPAPTEFPRFDGQLAMEHVVAQMSYGTRIPGSEGSRRCGDYILAQLATFGWSTEEQPFIYRDTLCRNLIGKRGRGPVLIIGAHYDTRRYANNDPNPENRTLPVPGANDGASGVAVLLELARILDPDALGRTIWLVCFDAEDNGRIDDWDWIVGSTYMAETLTIMPQGMLLVDMIGDADQQLYYEGNSHAEMRAGIWQVGADLGYTAFIPEVGYTLLDDHIPFIRKGIPSVDIIDFHYPYWHTIADTIDKTSAESLETVGDTVQQWLLLGAPGLPSSPYDYEEEIPTPEPPTPEPPTPSPTVIPDDEESGDDATPIPPAKPKPVYLPMMLTPEERSK